jgi:hypothetical protein
MRTINEWLHDIHEDSLAHKTLEILRASTNS